MRFSYLAYISINSLKMKNIGEIDWVLGTAPKFGLREKKIKIKETTRVEWIEANSALKIIIFRYFAFFLN